ncbi:hypothetical protein [Bythopirellula polymerisocia]|uniref:Uncharacterized protein n=1 Tax=Bythopirellula polymerisocia TaxID=2528003 RepID=A0A5C6CS62_9BACT|nr:hypothetical protein [Bythopirellula polymerisocia]TWU25916.1 hypothetical protein Pla144_31300 [Bythopirellula polymerisocia]
MDAWTMFWGWLLVIVLLVYAFLAIVITIGGFFDVKMMFTTMVEQHKERMTDDE